jgi:predicted PurR-regulated permease PerM
MSEQSPHPGAGEPADPFDRAAFTRAAEAASAALHSDALLLEEQAQRLHAQVTEARPFGVPSGTSAGGRSAIRTGFTVTTGGLIALAVGLGVRRVASELMLIIVAAFIAIGLEPAVALLTRRGMRRSYAVAVIIVGGLGLLAAFLAAAAPPIVSEAQQLVRHSPDYLRQLQDKHTTIGRLNASWHLVDRVQALTDRALSLKAFGGLLGAGALVLSYTFQLVIVLVLVIYFLADFPGIKRAAYRLAPLERRPRVGLIGDEIIARTGGYVLGNLFTSLIATVAQYVVLRTLDVPFALALAVLVGLFDLVPLVGSTIAGVVVTTVTLATVSTTAALINVVFTVVYRLFEDYVLSPRILARTVEVKPAVTVIAVLLGGALLGVEGALIGVPVAAAIQLVVTQVVYPRTDSPRSAAVPADAFPELQQGTGPS